MKLKKFAALALAGVMAVSMLAGCNGKGTNTTPDNPGADDDGTETIPTSAVVNLFNNLQSVNNKMKVTFTDDADFAAALEEAVELYGSNSANASTVRTYLKNLTGMTFNAGETIVSKDADWSTQLSNKYGYYKGGVKFYEDQMRDTTNADQTTARVKAAKNGETRTWLMVAAIQGKNTNNVLTGSILSPDAAVRNVMSKLNSYVFSKLDETTLTTKTAVDDPYLDYSYTGTACAVSAVDNTGAPIYYVACTITQTVAKDTLKAPV